MPPLRFIVETLRKRRRDPGSKATGFHQLSHGPCELAARVVIAGARGGQRYCDQALYHMWLARNDAWENRRIEDAKAIAERVRRAVEEWNTA